MIDFKFLITFTFISFTFFKNQSDKDVLQFFVNSSHFTVIRLFASLFLDQRGGFKMQKLKKGEMVIVFANAL